MSQSSIHSEARCFDQVNDAVRSSQRAVADGPNDEGVRPMVKDTTCLPQPIAQGNKFGNGAWEDFSNKREAWDPPITPLLASPFYPLSLLGFHVLRFELRRSYLFVEAKPPAC